MSSRSRGSAGADGEGGVGGRCGHAPIVQPAPAASAARRRALPTMPRWIPTPATSRAAGATSRFVDRPRPVATTCSNGATRSPRPARPPLVMLHGWMDVAASFQFVVDALAEDRHVLALDWRGFGAHRHAGRRHLLLPRVPGRPRAGARRAVRRRPRADRPARPQHGRQRRDALRGRAAGAHPPPRQPRRLRHAALAAGAGARAHRLVAGRAEAAGAAASLRRRSRPSPPACSKTNPLLRADRAALARGHWSRRVPGETARPTAGTCSPTRTTSARARSSPRSTNGSSSGSASPRRCSGSRATAPTSASGGATATPRPSSTSG